MIEKFAKKIIELHGFGSNTMSGFSCYIPDSSFFSQSEGILIWNYSRAYSRFETQIQKFSAQARIFRIEEMLSLQYNDYRKEIIDRIYEYKSTLLSVGGFKEIGNGANVFGESKIKNVGASFQEIKHDLTALKEFEKWTINNPIVKFAESKGYFKCLNKDKLAWDEFFRNNL